VWRNEKVGPGRFREFWQCDADTVGAASPAADAEMIAMACAALEAAGVTAGSYVVNVSTRQLLDGVLGNVVGGSQRLIAMRAIDKLDRLGLDGVRDLLGPGRTDESGDRTPGANLDPGEIDVVLGFLAVSVEDRESALGALSELGVQDAARWQDGLRTLQLIHETLTALGVDSSKARFNPSIVRGLEYYTGPVYEIELLGEMKDEDGRPARFGSVGGGGRYDDLVARFRGERIAATGVSIGVSRLAAALNAQSVEEDGPVVVLALEQDQMAAYFATAAALRRSGVKAEVYLGAGRFGAQLKYADKRNAPLAIIIGSDEREKGQVTIKDLKLGAQMSKAIADNETWRKGRPAQVTVERAALLETVREMLGRAP
jgi:histidyl-tRNA synthetase